MAPWAATSPKRRGKAKAAIPAPVIVMISGYFAATIGPRSRWDRPTTAVSMPLASMRSQPSAAVAHRTSWPASRTAWARGSIGWMCPSPDVEVNKTRIRPARAPVR